MKRLLGVLLGASALLPTVAMAQERGGWARSGGEAANERPQRVRPARAAEAPAPRGNPDEVRPNRSPRQGFGDSRADGPRPGFGPGGSRPGTGFTRPDRPTPQGGFERPAPQSGFDRPDQRPDRDTGFQRPSRSVPQGGYDRPGDRDGSGQNRGDSRGNGGRWIGRDNDGVWRDRNPDWNRGDRGPDRAGDGNHGRDVNRDRSGWNGGWRDNGDAGDRRGWNRNWRGDNRYDWQRFRQRDRSAFRLPRYYAPYGWGLGYRRFSVGVTIDSVLWGENYWIDDPYSYRLPPVYGPYRWVRYYNDALLVDVRSGYVVDAAYDIFW